MGRSFVCPDRELHGQATSFARRTSGRAKQLGEVGGLLVALDRREHQFDRPFGRHALGLQRIGEAEPAHHEIGPRGAAAVELPVDVLPFAQRDVRRQQLEFLGEMLAMQIGRADLDQLHRQFARQKARQRNFELRIGKQEDALAGELDRDSAPAPARARARLGARDALEQRADRRRTRRRRPAATRSCPRRPAGTARPAGSRRGLPARARCRRGTAAPAGNCVFGPTAGSAVERRGGRNCTGPMPSASNSRTNWSSTTSASAPTTSSWSSPVLKGGSAGTSEARQASSPCVNVVSIPLPE